jgi:hypothetical protein
MPLGKCKGLLTMAKHKVTTATAAVTTPATMPAQVAPTSPVAMPASTVAGLLAMAQAAPLQVAHNKYAGHKTVANAPAGATVAQWATKRIGKRGNLAAPVYPAAVCKHGAASVHGSIYVAAGAWVAHCAATGQANTLEGFITALATNAATLLTPRVHGAALATYAAALANAAAGQGGAITAYTAGGWVAGYVAAGLNKRGTLTQRAPSA